MSVKACAHDVEEDVAAAAVHGGNDCMGIQQRPTVAT